MSATLALALAHTGQAFTFFSPFLGWLGVFLTGSDTSANALFGALQATTAQQIGVPEVLLVAANTSGGVTGKMISPQSIAIACAAVGLVGKESDLFRFTVKHSITFTVMIDLPIVLMCKKHETILEGGSACMPQTCTTEDLALIRKYYDQISYFQSLGDDEQASLADAKFHLAIAERIANLVLIQMMRGVFALLLQI
ncbi:hypothetical protein FQR65_LT17996 [Abscondita terminalis]|nr:hypothetical protein FQR65_LT17996 [Abscondita terminalis]